MLLNFYYLDKSSVNDYKGVEDMSKVVRHRIIVGLALFAIFFGAGNLIFPPSIGNSAGESWISALMGFSLTGVILPVLAVYAIYNTGELWKRSQDQSEIGFIKPLIRS